jgi:hypothetical protein
MSFPRHNRNKDENFVLGVHFAGEHSDEMSFFKRQEKAQDMSSLRKMESGALPFVVCRDFNKNIIIWASLLLYVAMAACFMIIGVYGNPKVCFF